MTHCALVKKGVLGRIPALAAVALAILTVLVFQPVPALANEGSLAAGEVAFETSSQHKATSGASSEKATVKMVPVYRLYHAQSAENLFTASKKERRTLVKAGWRYQGVAWMAPQKGAPVYRLSHPKTWAHRYTTSAAERKRLMRAGWTDEGVAWRSVPKGDKARVAVYRQRNAKKAARARDVYTISSSQAKTWRAKGWKSQGTLGYGYKVPRSFKDDMLTASQLGVPVYQLYDWTTGERFFTTNKKERNQLANGRWFYEGIAWMAPAKGKPIYRLSSPKNGAHRFTASASERKKLMRAGWRYEGVAWYSATAGDQRRLPVWRQYNSKKSALTANVYTISKGFSKRWAASGWATKGALCYGYEVPSYYGDDMKPWKANLSGDEWLDRKIHLILADHKTLRSCFNYVAGLRYINGSKFYANPHVLSNKVTASYAKEMLRNGGGNCYRFACLFNWLAKGLGYDSRVISGWVPSASSGRAPHGWVEIKQNGRTFVCDPDMAKEIPSRNWYMNTYATAPLTYGSW